MPGDDAAGTPIASASPEAVSVGASPVIDAPDLLHGGLLYRVLARFGVDPEHAARSARRGALTGILLWSPSAVAALVEGNALPGRVAVPFLYDVAAYVRPLVVIPMLLISEAILGASWRRSGRFFRDRAIVGPACRGVYEQLVSKVTRSVRRTVPELLCLALAGFLTWKLVVLVTSAPRDAWFAAADGPSSSRLTVAGIWSGVVVHTFLFYLVLRWLWLLSLWYRFLFGVARLPLTLHPAHPDRAGGLGFLGRSVSACSPIAFALSASLASAVANRMLHHGEHLTTFIPVGATLLVFVLVVFVAPPALIFLPLLVRTRRLALEDWSRRMAFEADGPGGGAGATPAGAAEPGARMNLEELDIAVSAVRAMLPVPIAVSHLVGPVVATALPAVALLFLAFPAKEIFDKVMRLVA